MAKFRISGVPITEGKKLVGIITNRDLKFETDFSKKIKDSMTTENLVTAREGITLVEAKEILAKARKNGLINKDIEYSDKEIFQFITLPGFSTKEKVTELSGRGVGMDVVVKNISNVGGTLEIDSVQGKGSTMTLKIPLTLAIITGIVLKIGSSTFVVETNAVRDLVIASGYAGKPDNRKR